MAENFLDWSSLEIERLKDCVRIGVGRRLAPLAQVAVPSQNLSEVGSPHFTLVAA